MDYIDFKKEHILWIANEIHSKYTADPKNNINELRRIIEPWLTAVFQSEHLALLTGTGLTTAVCKLATGNDPKSMARIEFDSYKDPIKTNADNQAKEMGRGNANFEDDFRVAIELLKGLLILNKSQSTSLKDELNVHLITLIKELLQNESNILTSSNYEVAIKTLKRFLISFASRTATRDRLQIFTTNYDRFIEYALDLASIFTIDRFVGKIKPIFRTNKVELDYHYNPPGIRGEPRYVEGVVRYTKLHGSLDWKMDGKIISRVPLQFGPDKKTTDEIKNPLDTTVIFPNSAKGIETVFYPYSELFRDFSAAICRPNSVLVTYGYGFGDSHINQIIHDMLTTPSTHLVIISYGHADDRLTNFIKSCNPSQLTLLIGNHFADFTTLVDNYLPKAAIDRITERKHKIDEKRGEKQNLNVKEEES
jgi:hypothetical protein